MRFYLISKFKIVGVIVIMSLVYTYLTYKNPPTTNQKEYQAQELRLSKQTTPRKPEKINKVESTNALKITYRDFSKCPDPKSMYVEGYKAHCWQKCKHRCKSKDSEKIYCFPNLHLIGLRSCGTAGFSKWFLKHPQAKYSQQNYGPLVDMKCPTDYFEEKPWGKQDRVMNMFNDGPDNAVGFYTLTANATHLQVVTVPQLLGFMATPDTKFYMQLRNPTERVIYYLFRQRTLDSEFQNMTLDQIDGPFIHSVIKDQQTKLSKCISDLGELLCFYSIRPIDGNINSLMLHSLYAIILEEIFKFIPRNQVLVKTTREFKEERATAAKDVTRKFFNLHLTNAMISNYSFETHRSRKIPVLQSTLEYLDKFFEPYNRRLANLLGDDKWLFKVNRTLQNTLSFL